MRRRKALNLIVQAMAEDAVGKGGGGSVGPVAPTDHGSLRVPAGIPDVLTDNGSQVLHPPGGDVSHAVEDRNLGRRDHRRGQRIVLGIGNKLGQSPGSAHKVSVPGGLLQAIVVMEKGSI